MHYDLIEELLGRPIFPNRPGEPAGLPRSIRNNLKMLLNARRGSLAHMPDYGLPDISIIYREFPDSIEMLRRAIADSINLYEPRLTGVEVDLTDRRDKIFQATYLVSAKIVGTKDGGNIAFRTRINADGKMEIL